MIHPTELHRVAKRMGFSPEGARNFIQSQRVAAANAAIKRRAIFAGRRDRGDER